MSEKQVSGFNGVVIAQSIAGSQVPTSGSIQVNCCSLFAWIQTFQVTVSVTAVFKRCHTLLSKYETLKLW